jgi:phage regulator Rha-like protein
MSIVTLMQVKGEVRVDSRLLAEQLGTKHKSTMVLIDRYADQLKQFGQLPFQMTVGKRVQGGGNSERFALLNEDQAFALLALSRNTERVVALKVGLVMAFRESRAKSAITSTQYLPLYHALHDEVAQLAKRAHDCGSDAPERVFHMNANRALNAAMGLASGERSTLTIEQRLLLTTLQAVYTRALHVSIEAGDGHKEAGHKAKAAALAFVERAGHLLIGSAAA